MEELEGLNFKKAVKHMMIEKNMTQKVLGEKMGFQQKQGISQFLSKKDFKLNKDIIPVADILGYDVKLTMVDRQTGKTIEVD